jgi:murein tripeptide amidase MpaA
MDLITVAAASGDKKPVWIIARQHPGESMAEWFVEGLIERLVDQSDPVSRRLCERAVLYIVPNMNPDGSVRGNLRTNAAGANLNREWMTPSMETSPEVFLVRERLQRTGVHAFFDVHGDEALPYVFIAGGEMLPGFGEEQARAQREFVTDFKRSSPDFQDVHGYSAGKYNEDALKLASKWVGHTFGCLSLTLEMPFKDNANLPDFGVGWNGERSRKLGAAMLQPLLASVAGDI